MKNIKYSSYDYKFGAAFSGGDNESFSYVKLPYEVSPEGPKILFVLDYMPAEDLKTGRLLSGATRDVLGSLISLAQSYWLRRRIKFSWMGCTFNAYRTAGKDRVYQQHAKEVFTRRITDLVSKYKPDVIVGFGRQVFEALAPKRYELSGTTTPWLGVPVTVKLGGHKCKLISTLSLKTFAEATREESSVMGYIARNLANALTNDHLYRIDAERIDEHKTVLIDTVTKFDKMLDMLHDQPVVAVDTETENLNRIANKLLIIQFAKCIDYGYVVPVRHKDSPFTGSEIRHIEKRLQYYFEGRNKNEYHVYAYAQFDLNIIRNQVGARYMGTDVWDIFAGEYGIDENMKALKSFTGDDYYSLGNLTMQYGSTAYLTGEFGKEDRGSISTRSLDAPLLRYCSLDVVIPWAIQEQQRALAEHLNHAGYEALVRHQLSDMIHGFSRMESTGVKLDVNYLFHLKSPSSPIEKIIVSMEAGFNDMESVKAANARLLKAKGIPQNSLWGATTNVFSLRKDEHKHLLFFDVLKLKPVSTGASGQGKLDKEFQEKYKDVPEIHYYTEIGKAKKLKNAYVNSFIRLLGKSDDLKKDHRIRPSYNYTRVVTGRTSASNPNLQQIPARSELGKNIKRLFIARLGCLYIKVDYRVHEVRGWGLISFDKGVAELFKAAKALRDSYRSKPYPELAKRLKLEADVHVINAAYFFGVPVEKVDKALRADVKGVIFGLIYQMSIKTLAGTLGKTVEFTDKLVSNFNKRFPAGMKWIEDAKKIARKLLYIENPIGFRRHLWGYVIPESVKSHGKIRAEMDRRAVNSPVQGMCAQFMAVGSRALDTWVWKIWKTEKRKVDLMIENSVHDSLENTAAYENLLEAVGMIEEALTTRVRQIMYERHGFKFVVDLEIDFEIGAALSQCSAWDFSLTGLERIVYKSLVFQRDELKYEVDVKEAMEQIFLGDGWARAPKWMHVQAKNIGWKFNYKGLLVAMAEEKKQQEAEKAKAELEAKSKTKNNLKKAA